MRIDFIMGSHLRSRTAADDPEKESEKAANELRERTKSPRAAFIIPGRKAKSGQKRAGGTLVWTPGGGKHYPFSGLAKFSKQPVTLNGVPDQNLGLPLDRASWQTGEIDQAVFRIGISVLDDGKPLS
jgi:hypothetical protein